MDSQILTLLPKPLMVPKCSGCGPTSQPSAFALVVALATLAIPVTHPLPTHPRPHSHLTRLHVPLIPQRDQNGTGIWALRMMRRTTRSRPQRSPSSLPAPTGLVRWGPGSGYN